MYDTRTNLSRNIGTICVPLFNENDPSFYRQIGSKDDAFMLVSSKIPVYNITGGP